MDHYGDVDRVTTYILENPELKRLFVSARYSTDEDVVVVQMERIPPAEITQNLIAKMPVRIELTYGARYQPM